MNKLKHSRESVKGKITRFLNYMQTFSTSDTKNYNELKLRRATLEQCLEEFNAIQAEIELKDNEIDEDERQTFETLFYSACGRADDILEGLKGEAMSSQTPPTNNQLDIHTQVKLPPINIPTFTGSYEQWNDFYDLFQSLIDKNVSLSPVQKFHYLKSSLQGDALQVIQSIETTETNYRVALGLLKERFENKKLITLSHIKNLFELPAIQKENYNSLRSFFDTFQRHVRSLKSMQHTDEVLVDLLLLFLLSSKLDHTTLREWEKRAMESEGLSTYGEFCRFLQQRCNLLETLHRNLVQTSQSQVGTIKNFKSNPRVGYSSNKNMCSSYLATQTQGGGAGCPICSKQHRFFACEKFLKMSVQERINEVKKLRLCLNCLGVDHTYARCQLGPCKKCSKKHNSLLHIENSEKISNNISQVSKGGDNASVSVG